MAFFCANSFQKHQMGELLRIDSFRVYEIMKNYPVCKHQRFSVIV